VGMGGVCVAGAIGPFHDRVPGRAHLLREG
jgi:hypothetical protein